MKGYGIIATSIPGWIEKNKPVAGPLDAILRPRLITPCTSDIHSLHGGGSSKRDGRIMGHEAVGEVVEIGRDVKEIKVGDIVAVPIATPDWGAPGTQEGYSTHDWGMMKGFKLLAQKDGTMAEFFHVNQADYNLAPIPSKVAPEAALMVVDMMSTGFYAVEMAEVKYGDTVVVMGIGPVGLMAVAGAALRGAGRIIAIGTRPSCVKVAKEYGASEIVSYKEGDLVEQILDLTSGGADKTIIAGGDQNSFGQAVRMTRATGTISNVNFFNVKDRLCMNAIDWGLGMADKTIRGGLCPGGRVRLERLMKMIEYGRVDPTKLITHRYHGFEQIEPAFKIMEEKPADLIKPVVFIDW